MVRAGLHSNLKITAGRISLIKTGYGIANIVIPLYTNGDDEEELSSLKAVTYNLVNGEVTETKLEIKSAVFKDKISKNWVVRKFTFPAIKEGSIIEYEYKVQSNFKFNLQPWEFQGAYPELWSEYNVTMPEFYYYVTLSQGYQPFHIKDQKKRSGNFVVSDNTGAGSSDRTTFSAGVTDYRWVMKDVPALKEESYTSTLSNHISKIEFQLAERRLPLSQQNIMGTWTQTCEELLQNENFGYSLDRDNPWLDDVITETTVNTTNRLEKARNIYAYLRDNMTCTNYNRMYLEQSLKNVLKNRNGNEAEINLLLVAMLRKAGLDAEPVMLSTRSHGYTYAMYPLIERFQLRDSKNDNRWYHVLPRCQ
ncbi:MAG: transglutaminase domain-containing protein [Bacteroidota bacterium]